MKNAKLEKGSMSVFVIVAFIFCMTILVNIYWSNANHQVTVLQAQQRIQEVYGLDAEPDRMDEIHAGLGSGTGGGTPVTPSVDSSYWKTGTMKLCTIDGRDYTKVNSTGAICGAGYWYSNGTLYASPVLISTNAEAVKYSTSYDDQTWGSYTTISYNGVTYYCAGDTYAMHTNFDSTNVPVVNTADTAVQGHQELAKMVLDKYFCK